PTHDIGWLVVLAVLVVLTASLCALPFTVQFMVQPPRFPASGLDSTPTSELFGITTGPDGALWFTDPGGNRIGQITTSGQVRYFPAPSAQSYPGVITEGPDGALWFTEHVRNEIGRITTSGQLREFPLPAAGSSPGGSR